MVHSLNAKELKRVNEGLPPWESLSFACGGWLQFYMFGVAKALQVSNYHKGVKYYGCSAGALTAIGLVVDGEYDDAIQFCKDYCVPRAYADIMGLFNLGHYVTRCLEMQLLERYHDLPEGVLNVAVTRLPYFERVRATKFASKDELIDYLLASSAAFPFAPVKKIGDSWYIDGGLSDFQPIENEETITVSPFYFDECDIKPSRYVPLWWTFLPPYSKRNIDWLYNLGMQDCVSYLKSRGLPLNNEVQELVRRHIVDHPYNEKRRISVQRFLGYEMNRVLSFILDGILLILLLFVWKPLALLLIYAELFARIVLLTSVSLFHSMLDLSPPQLFNSLVLRPYYFLMSRLVGSIFLQQNIKVQDQSIRNRTIAELWECMSCVWSLSLFLRFLSGRPMEQELRKHKRLAKFSIIYRVFMHII